MSTIILDTLSFADKLNAGGFTDQQAEAQTRAFAEVIDKQITTKHDVDAYETNIKRDIQESENRLEFKIELLRAETKQAIAETKAELIRWVVAVGVLQTTLIIGVLLKIAHLI